MPPESALGTGTAAAAPRVASGAGRLGGQARGSWPAGHNRSEGKERKGIWERGILDYIATLDTAITSIETEALIKAVVETMPPPEEGKRDYRQQNVTRALTGLCSGRHPVLAISHGRVEFLGPL